MRSRALLAVLLAAILGFAAPTAQAAPAAALNIREESLAKALVALSRQTGVELIFDHRLVRGLTAAPISGRLSAEAALSRLLAGAGVGYRATPEGAYVLFAIPAPRVVPVSDVRPSDGAISELLVVGRRTQNVDIRRTRDDIQPYRVQGRREIEASGRETVDDFLRAREPANARPGAWALGGGEPRSQIDLRGLGETSTLVLVDGRRMPMVPSLLGEFSQADINGVPLGAVERIEILTTTAGGIYGSGAIGGVVNVVMRRDYRGADLAVHSGISDRGDAGYGRIEGRVGFTPDHGKTDIMLFLSHAENSSLRTGQRDYVERADRRRFANDPDAYAAELLTRNGVSVVSYWGDELTLDPSYGGLVLGSRYTFLPLGFAGTPAEAGALLAANAGKLPLELADDFSGKRGYIATAPSVTSGLLNVRRRIGSDIELFVDGLYGRNRGHWSGGMPATSLTMGADRPGNPFGQDIRLRFPIGPVRSETDYALDFSRWTGGFIASLPRGWKVAADYTAGYLSYRAGMYNISTGNALAVAVTGRPGLAGAPPIFPFENWSAVTAALPAYLLEDDARDQFRFHQRASDASFRLAGPLLQAPGGPLTATLSIQDRQDRVADSTFAFFDGFALPVPSREQRVRSGYGELRAPLGASDAGNPLLRGLEVQLAVRHDRSTQRGSVLALDDNERFSVHDAGTTFTAGARVTPIRRLMLRGSLATGERLPTLSNLQSIPGEFGGIEGSPDPRRGGRQLGSEGSFTNLLGGSTRVGSAHARSFTLGAVLNPNGPGPRLSLDYSRIVVSREPISLTFADVLAVEAQFPDRVTRAPLTAADAEGGLTAGRVIHIDATFVNAGRTIVEAVDAQLDWRIPLERHDVRLYGAVTWQPTFLRRRSFSQAPVNRVGYIDGPLEWRGNVGVEWVIGDTAIDLNAQYYGQHRVSYADFPVSNPQYIRYQGADRVPAQVYLDLNLRRRFMIEGAPIPAQRLEARLAVHNLLDHSPPIVAPSISGFSEYGDPRRRRFVLTLSARF